MKEITIQASKHKDVIDVTDNINNFLVKSKSVHGLCHLFLPHSTAGLTTALINLQNELELIDAFEVSVPHVSNQLRKHEHSHIKSHLPNHIISSFLGISLLIPILNQKLCLGEFQAVVLVELNGPRDRSLLISIIKEQ